MTVKLGKYRHFKGEIMEVVGTALHSETKEELVVYRHVNGSRAGEENYWVRPIGMFLEKVVVDGKEMPRFEFVG